MSTLIRHLFISPFRLFGDDCIIQWTREGKRGAPLLYRSKPYTTITITANEAAEYVRRMNRKLPDPTMVRRRGEPHDETTSIKSNLILADPLRSAPLQRPTSIAPQLQTIPAAVYRNASTVAETASHCAGGKSETKAAFKNKRGAAAAARRQEQVPSKILAKAVPIGKTFATSSRRPTTLKKSPQKRKNAAETPNHRRGASKQVGGGGRKRKADESPEIPPDIDHPSHHRLPPPLMLLLQDHVPPPPQIAKSKRDISSNCQKLTQNAPPTQGIKRQSSAENAPRKPSQLKFVPIKGLATITSSVSSSSSNNSHPPPSKVQIIDPTILSPSEDVPDSAKGSILFQHLQRKVAPKPTANSSTSSSKENGSTYHGNKQTHDNPGSHGLNVKRTAGLSREETRIQTIGNGHRGERHAVLGVSKSDGLVESIIFNEEVEDLEQEIILEEIVEEEEVVLCEINDSAEIIEEEVCELDYVSMEEPIELYGGFLFIFHLRLLGSTLIDV